MPSGCRLRRAGRIVCSTDAAVGSPESPRARSGGACGGLAVRVSRRHGSALPIGATWEITGIRQKPAIGRNPTSRLATGQDRDPGTRGCRLGVWRAHAPQPRPCGARLASSLGRSACCLKVGASPRIRWSASASVTGLAMRTCCGFLPSWRRPAARRATRSVASVRVRCPRYHMTSATRSAVVDRIYGRLFPLHREATDQTTSRVRLSRNSIPTPMVPPPLPLTTANTPSVMAKARVEKRRVHLTNGQPRRWNGSPPQCGHPPDRYTIEYAPPKAASDEESAVLRDLGSRSQC